MRRKGEGGGSESRQPVPRVQVVKGGAAKWAEREHARGCPNGRKGMAWLRVQAQNPMETDGQAHGKVKALDDTESHGGQESLSSQ